MLTKASTELTDATREADPAGARRPAGHLRGAVELASAAYDRLQRHAGDSLAGGLAFGALLSLAPLLLVVIAVGTVLVGDEARRQALDAVGETLGSEAQTLVATWVVQAEAWSGSATVVGLVLFVYGASRLVGLVDQTFEIVFEVPRQPKLSMWETVKLYLKTQAISIVVTLGCGVLLIASLGLRGLGAWVFGQGDDPTLGVVWAILREVGSTAMWFGAIAILYAVLPPVKLSRSDILIGAGVSAVLVEVPLLLLRLLASVFDFGAAYGAAGAVVSALITLSIAGTLFLFGAELTAERAERRDGAGEARLSKRRTRCTKLWDDAISTRKC